MNVNKWVVILLGGINLEVIFSHVDMGWTPKPDWPTKLVLTIKPKKTIR